MIDGIDDEHWPLIHQNVMEAHYINGRVAEFSQLLARRGLSVRLEQDKLYHTSNIWQLYAIRQ